MSPFLISNNMKSFFYLSVIMSILSVGMVMYGVYSDDIRLFCEGIIGLVVSIPSGILIAEELDNRRV